MYCDHLLASFVPYVASCSIACVLVPFVVQQSACDVPRNTDHSDTHSVPQVGAFDPPCSCSHWLERSLENEEDSRYKMTITLSVQEDTGGRG